MDVQRIPKLLNDYPPSDPLTLDIELAQLKEVVEQQGYKIVELKTTGELSQRKSER